jgi:hypothetical protein
MKCSKLNEKKSKLIFQAFCDFKKISLEKNIHTFKLEGFINFINSSDYEIFGYTWHQNEKELEAENWGRFAISIHTVLECYANTSENSFVIDKNGDRVTLLKKVAPKTYMFI